MCWCRSCSPILAGACFLVAAAVLGSLTRASGPIEDHLPRIGSLMLASFGGMLVLFAAAWAVLHVWVVRPIRALTGEAETLALTQQSRALLMPPRHALERLPRAVEQLAQKLGDGARRDGGGDCCCNAARGGTEELARGDPARSDRGNHRLQSRPPHSAVQFRPPPGFSTCARRWAWGGRCSACSPRSRSCRRSSSCNRVASRARPQAALRTSASSRAIASCARLSMSEPCWRPA